MHSTTLHILHLPLLYILYLPTPFSKTLARSRAPTILAVLQTNYHLSPFLFSISAEVARKHYLFSCSFSPQTLPFATLLITTAPAHFSPQTHLSTSPFWALKSGPFQLHSSSKTAQTRAAPFPSVPPKTSRKISSFKLLNQLQNSPKATLTRPQRSSLRRWANSISTL